jgi:hypothetical protein
VLYTNTNSLNKTRVHQQTTGGKDGPNIILRGNHSGQYNRKTGALLQTTGQSIQV